MDESIQPEPDKNAIGALLQAERGKQKLTRQEVAEQLNLSESMISALENDEEFEGISPTYVRGYRRAYVRLLGIDESEVLVDPVVSSTVEKPQADLHYFDKNLDFSKSKKSFNILIKLVTVVALFAVALFAWPKISSYLGFNDEAESTEIVSGSNESQNVNESQQQVMVSSTNSGSGNNNQGAQGAIQEETTREGVTTKIINFANSLDQSKQLDQPVSDVKEDSSASAMQLESEMTELMQSREEAVTVTTALSENSEGEDTEVASVSQQETTATITFVSNGESWLSIEDAQNNNLYRNTLKLDRVSVTGELPLNVSTGNVGVLRLLGELGDQQKVGIFNDSKKVAKFFVDVDVDGKLKFSPK